MERRDLIRVVGVGVGFSASGCLGVFGGNSDDGDDEEAESPQSGSSSTDGERDGTGETTTAGEVTFGLDFDVDDENFAQYDRVVMSIDTVTLMRENGDPVQFQPESDSVLGASEPSASQVLDDVTIPTGSYPRVEIAASVTEVVGGDGNDVPDVTAGDLILDPDVGAVMGLDERFDGREVTLTVTLGLNETDSVFELEQQGWIAL